MNVAHRNQGLQTPSSLRVMVHTLDSFPSPLSLYMTEFQTCDASFFLESSVVRPGFSRFSFMGDAGGPLGESITYDAASRELQVSSDSGVEQYQVNSVFDYLQHQLCERSVPCPENLPFDFNLGYVGVFGYELKAETIGVAPHSSSSHDGVFLFASRMVVFDHLEQRCYLLHLAFDDSSEQQAVRWFSHIEKRALQLQSDVPPAMPYKKIPTMSLSEVENWITEHATIRHSKQSYIDKIHQALQEIVDGESYEVCLTNSIELPFSESPFELYRMMRELTPAPHAGYFNVGEFHLVSSSPERFIKVDKEGYAEAKPIKGTRPRGKTPAEDMQQIEELKNNEKDKAENLMIVDLLRNDLGQSCQLRSVRVPRLFDIETYSHVHQLVSTICGRLKPDVTTMECVRAVFPGGSMTGAPKKRTMEIIDRLEEGPRGVYSGAFGWFGLSQACDLNIVIRSVAVDKGVATFGVGGALTALSDPEDEFAETMVKARGVVEAVQSIRGERV